MKMKRTVHSIIAAIAAFTAVLFSGQRAGAQEMKDSLVYHQAAALDSTLLGRSVFNIISSGKSGEGEVKIHQSQAISTAMQSHISGNRDKAVFYEIHDVGSLEYGIVRLKQAIDCIYEVALRLDFFHHLGGYAFEGTPHFRRIIVVHIFDEPVQCS